MVIILSQNFSLYNINFYILYNYLFLHLLWFTLYIIICFYDFCARLLSIVIKILKVIARVF